jgi:hypothetical protein
VLVQALYIAGRKTTAKEDGLKVTYAVRSKSVSKLRRRK